MQNREVGNNPVTSWSVGVSPLVNHESMSKNGVLPGLEYLVNQIQNWDAIHDLPVYQSQSIS